MDPLPTPIDTLGTPNPDALMFRLPEPLVEAGTYEFTSPEEAAQAPLARRLFTLDSVRQVLIASRFVTVTRDPAYEWPEVVPSVKALLRAHLASGEPAVDPDAQLKASGLDSDLARKVAALIDEEIRPAVAMDGGDVQFMGLTDDLRVRLRLVGSCSTCPSATATLAFGIERLLLEEFPELQGVEQVM